MTAGTTGLFARYRALRRAAAVYFAGLTRAANMAWRMPAIIFNAGLNIANHALVNLLMFAAACSAANGVLRSSGRPYGQNLT